MLKFLKIYLISITCLLITLGASLCVNAQTYYGNRFQVTSAVSMGYLNALSKKASLRFTAQVSKTVNSFRLYIYDNQSGSKIFRYGIQQDNGGTPSGTWLGYKDLTITVSSGWLTVTLTSGIALTSGTVYHIVVQPVDKPTKAITLQATTPLNQMIVYDNASDPNSNTLFNDGTGWTIQNYQPIYLLGYSDATYEGNPCSSPGYGSIYGTQYESERFTITGGDKTINEISVFLKCAGAPPNNCQFVLYNITDAVEVASGTIATSSEITTSYAWYTYNLSTTKTLIDGKQYRLYLKTTGGNSSNYYIWHMPYNYSSAEYNSRNYDGLNSINQTSTDGGSSWSLDWPNYDAVFRFTVSALSVSLSNNTFTFGTQPLNTWMTPQSSVVTNDGSVVENFIGRISQFTDGANTWGISSTTNGDNIIRAQWSTTSATGPWNDISAYATDFTIATNVAVNGSVTFYFRIQTPTSTTSYSQYSSALTVTAQ